MKYIFPVVVSSLGSLTMYMYDKKINPLKKIRFKFGKKKLVESKSETNCSIRRIPSTTVKKTSGKWKSRVKWFRRIVNKIINYKGYLKKTQVFLELEPKESSFSILCKKINNLPWTSALTILQDYDDSHDLNKLELSYATRATTY